MELIKGFSKNIIKDVLVQEDLGFSSDAKEAMAFVILGNETLRRVTNNVPSATGANENVVLGMVTFGHNGK